MSQQAMDRGPETANIDQGFPPPTAPVEPLRPAPARFGAAGISAGEDRFYKAHIPPDPAGARKAAGDALAVKLGWFSIGLGLAEVLGARGLARWLGMERASWLLRLYGLREIGAGVGILASHRPEDRSPWMLARVGGDALDLATLAPGLHPGNPNRDRVAFAMLVVGGVTALDVAAASMTSGGGAMRGVCLRL